MFCFIESKNKITCIPLNNPIKNSGLGLVVGIIWIILPVVLPILFEEIEVQATNQVDSFWIWAVALFLNAIMQELLVRGYLFAILKSQYNSLVAITFTTALFTLLHGGAFEAGTISVLNVISMSIFMSVILIRTKSLVAPLLCILFGISQVG